tara:strand:+ start:1449 stop:2309 length:861 start_codon:yes stop_codon:yes gene_type:complete
MISSKTAFFALIGNPVSHSLSPIMHNAVLKHLGLDLVYLSFPCEEIDFEIVINSLNKINCKGVNITIPFKEKVIKYCSYISPIAKKIKAVNTLKPTEKNEWHGINTDVAGLINPLEKLYLKNKKSIVLGSGGASRSAIQGLIDLELSEIIIVSRNSYAIENLLKDFKDNSNIKGILSNSLDIHDYMNSTDLIINATPVGMKHKNNVNEELPFGLNFWKSLHSKTIVYDLIYNPKETKLLKHCKTKGCHTINGTKMLIAQGAKSLSYWMDGLDIPLDIMEVAIKDYL